MTQGDTPSTRTIAALRRALVRWFREGHRKLPWRDEPTPYRVWVSEIMAQQTRIGTVVPYFERFVERFPDVRTLAAAPLGGVLALWSGLGYYGRARNLHAAARAILLRHGGEVPGDVTALRALPGIGRYTAGAIASIAFGARVPVVDGNVTRILTRVFDIDIGVWTAPARRRLWAIAEKLADDPDPGAVNQGLMELGARVCAPRDPACPVCPLRAQCLARRRGTIPSRPVVKAKKAVPVIRLLAAVVRRADGSVLLVRGPEDGLFGGLWGVPLHPATGRTAAAKRLALRLALAKDGLGAAVVGERAATIAHVLSHRRLVVDVFTARWQGRAPRIARGRPCRFVRTRAELDGLGVSALTRKVLAAAGPS